MKDNLYENILDQQAVERYGKAQISLLTNQQRYELCVNIGECVQEEELKELFIKRKHPICYDGFEPSGRMHISQGILKALNVNKLTKSGCIFVFWIADLYAILNNKMNAEMQKIKDVGNYFIEIWKAAGMNMENVRFLWASDEIFNSQTYFLRMMDISKSFNISRIKRCSQIMGRSEGDDQPTSQILYPCMQCSDIFHLKADICQLGLDQRKINVLAREYAANKELVPPIILSHPMIPSLVKGEEKMSKSNPFSAIFMEDTAKVVEEKIKKAYCPPKETEGNPLVKYVILIIFAKYGEFEVIRSEKNGGNTIYKTEQQFIESYQNDEIHPADLKYSLAKSLNNLIEPIRQHFLNDEYAKNLLKKVSSYTITK